MPTLSPTRRSLPWLLLLALLASPGAAALGNPVDLTLFVRDLESSAPLGGATVTLYDRGVQVGSGFTDIYGRFEHTSNPPGLVRELTWTVSEPGCLTSRGRSKFRYAYVYLYCSQSIAFLLTDGDPSALPVELGGAPVIEEIVPPSDDPDAPLHGRVAFVILSTGSGANESRAVRDGTRFDLGLDPAFEIGRSVRVGDTFAIPMISGPQFFPALQPVGPGSVTTADRQLLSSFFAGSADALPTEEPRIAFLDRARSSYAVYDVGAGGAASPLSATFETYLVPTTGIVGPIDGGIQPAWASSDPTATTPTVWNFGSHFDAVQSLPAAGKCQPYTEDVTATLNAWRGDTLLHVEDLFGIHASFGLHCAPPMFTAEASTESAAFFTLNRGDRLFLVAKDTAAPARAADVLDLGSVPDRGPLPSTPTMRADRESGALQFGIAGRRLFGWSEDSWRLGLEPWETDTAPVEIFDGPGFPYALDRSLGGSQGYLVANYAESDITNHGGDGPGRSNVPALAAMPLDGCLSNDRFACLNRSRFRVQATYLLDNGERGDAHMRPLSSDSATAWFFKRKNRELIVKLLDGCAVNGHYWFFAAGLTNVGVEITVTDSAAEESVAYGSELGVAFAPIFDTAAFDCGPSPSEANAESPVTGRWRGALRQPEGKPLAAGKAADEAAGSSGSACGGGEHALCLAGGRFRVEVDWTDSSGKTGSGFGGNLTDDTGALFFFDAANVEMLVKALDACTFNSHFWLFAGALTNVGVELTVTDTVTGVTQTYTNQLGTDFAAITDTKTFPCN